MLPNRTTESERPAKKPQTTRNLLYLLRCTTGRPPPTVRPSDDVGGAAIAIRVAAHDTGIAVPGSRKKRSLENWGRIETCQGRGLGLAEISTYPD
jgi:hypothetical protein